MEISIQQILLIGLICGYLSLFLPVIGDVIRDYLDDLDDLNNGGKRGN